LVSKQNKEMISNLLAFTLLLLGRVWSQSIDLRTNARVTHAWMETGFVDVNDATWASVSSLGQEYVNPIILTALPDLGGALYTEGLATATRIRNVVNTAGQVSFEVKVRNFNSPCRHSLLFTDFLSYFSSSNRMTPIVPSNGMFLNILLLMLKLAGLLPSMVLTMFPPNTCSLLDLELPTEPVQLLALVFCMNSTNWTSQLDVDPTSIQAVFSLSHILWVNLVLLPPSKASFTKNF
jgi:hypothetical protein